jgi:cell division septation protein DedD
MSSKFILAAAVLIATSAPVGAQSVKLGADAWQRGDYAAAVAIWRPLAEKGEPEAQFDLGQAYRLGKGVTTSLATAQTWFERAAEQGQVDAQTTLGLLLFQNGDQASGLKWLKKAADQGEPRAMLVFGTALFNGDGVPQDPVRGYAYVSRSAGSGLAAAKQTLDQLDQLLPAAERKRGMAMASDLAKSVPAPRASRAKSAAKPVEMAAAKEPPQPAAKPVETAAARPPAKAAKAAPKEAPPTAAAASPASGNWRIQLGAFSQRGNAEALYKKVFAKPAFAGRQPYYVAAGAVTRLQVGPFESSAMAQAACKSAGVPCFPVRAK